MTSRCVHCVQGVQGTGQRQVHGEPDTGSAYTHGQGGAEEDEVARVRPFDNAEQRNATLDVYYAIRLCVVYNTRGGCTT